MAIYRVPDFTGTIGKELPSLGPFRNFKPKIYGPGSGKFKAAVAAGQFVWKHKERIFGILTGNAIGTGLLLDGSQKNARSYKQYQTLRSQKQLYNRGRRSKQRQYNNCCCGSSHK